MGLNWTIEIEPPKALDGGLELALLQEALARNPELGGVAVQVGRRLLVDDRFDEVIALLEPRFARDQEYIVCSLLVQAHMSRETELDTRRALDLARQGLALAENPGARAHMLADIGKAMTRLGEHDAALAALRQALDENPHDRNAYKRIAAHHLRADQPQAVLEIADGLISQGIGHSRLLASRVLALAQMGDMVRARAASGLDEFLHIGQINAPPGWTDLASFNAALAEQLLGHPALRYDRYGTASTRTWRIDQPAVVSAPLVSVLQQEIARHVEAYVTRLDGAQHPWMTTRPPQGMLHNWCVITDSDGQEEWHVHQNGWLSGVYYVTVPAIVREGSGEAGCVAFGLPEDLVGADTAQAYGQSLLRPEPGLLALFPSHTYHRTFPHGVDSKRICLAFDIWPN